jgi:hypothetical protein
MVAKLSVGGLVAHAGFGSTMRGRRFFVVSPPVRDLLLCAKHLFVAAMVASGGHKTMAGSGHHFASGQAPMIKKRRTYLPRIVGDKVMMPAD